MLFVSIVRPRGGTSKERAEKRVSWKLPEGVRVVAEYWLQSGDITAITIFETDNADLLYSARLHFADHYAIDTFPAITAEDGLKLLASVGGPQ